MPLLNFESNIKKIVQTIEFIQLTQIQTWASFNPTV